MCVLERNCSCGSSDHPIHSVESFSSRRTDSGVPRVADLYRAAFETNDALIEWLNAGKPLDQGALACAVVPYECRHLTGLDGEINSLEHIDRTETLGDTRDL